MIFTGLVLSSSVFATWQKVFTFKYGRTGTCGFFFNEFVGFVGTSADAGGILKTTDGGKSWSVCTLPPNYVDNVTQIQMTDEYNGWASVEDQSNVRTGILRTTDGGLTWTAAGPKGDYSCIYATPSAVVAVSRGNYGTGEISTNLGASWTVDNTMKFMNGIDFVDDMHGVATGFYATSWKRTVDGGRTWTAINPPQQTESWGVYGVKGTSYFLACPEKDQTIVSNQTIGSVMISSDYGSTWSIIYPNLVGSTGTVVGANGAIYIQAYNNKSVNPTATGLYRSTDMGKTWVNVGGPSSQKDTRFVATGCNGGVVYAFDQQGNIWKTRDGGDGAITEPPFDLIFDANSISMSGPICSTTFATVRLRNPYCEDDSLVSVTLIDSSSPLFSSGALSLVSQMNLPLILRQNEQDSLVFRWDPSKLFHRDTNIITKVRLHYYSTILQRFLDTVVTITAHAIGQRPQASLEPASMNFGPVRFCTPYDSLFTIKNNSCDTLYIIGYTALQTGGYILTNAAGDPLMFPLALTQGDSVMFRVRLSLDVAGPYTNRLTFHLLHQGIGTDSSISFSASMSSTGSFAFSDSLHVEDVSTCSELDTFVLVHNYGCKPLVINSVSLQNQVAFFIVGTPGFTSPIPPDSTGKIFIKFKPPTATIYTDRLSINIESLGEGSVLTIPLQGAGVTQPAMLLASLPIDTLFALRLTRCDSPKQFLIHIGNPGCQTLSILSITQSSTTDPNVTVSHGAVPTTFTSAGAGLDIRVVADPNVVRTDSGTITIRFQLQGEPARDTVVRYYLTVGYGSRTLTVAPDTLDLGTMKFCDTRDTTIFIRSEGCDTVELLSTQVTGNGNLTLEQPPSIMMPSGTTFPLRLHFEPTMAGAISGVITISAHSDPDSIKQIPIIANVIPTDTLTFDFSASKDSIRAGDTITFVMVPKQDVHFKALQNISFVLHYNGDLLTFIPKYSNVLVSNAVFSADPPGGTPKHTTTHISLQGVPFLDFTAGQPAIKLTFVAALTDSISSTMYLSDIKLNNDDQIYAKCELGVVSVVLEYSLALGCGDPSLIRYMQLGNAETLLLGNVQPDPISAATAFRTSLPFTTHLAGDVVCELFDALGHSILYSTQKDLQTGKHVFSLDLSSVPSGTYTYIVRHTANNASVAGRLSVVR